MLGRYALGARRSGAGYDAEEQAQLQALAQQAALALAYADTFDALNELNRELEQRVADRTAELLVQQRALAVTEERRRLARDLHDSVTQTLFSLSLGARAIRGLLRRNPAAAADALGEQEAAARQALAEMRALLAQLREPDGVGDVPARSLAAHQEDVIALLAEHCAQLQRQSGLDVSLEAPITLALPATVAREFFAIAREALHNVVKHSGVDSARCVVRLIGSDVLLTVADAGCGAATERIASGGLGLRGMRRARRRAGRCADRRSDRGSRYDCAGARAGSNMNRRTREPENREPRTGRLSGRTENHGHFSFFMFFSLLARFSGRCWIARRL